tara:strand:- start:2029 stop:2178 length:150 start_codon:yes stop_codon:yes gene_type:complete
MSKNFKKMTKKIVLILLLRNLSAFWKKKTEILEIIKISINLYIYNSVKK